MPIINTPPQTGGSELTGCSKSCVGVNARTTVNFPVDQLKSPDRLDLILLYKLRYIQN